MSASERVPILDWHGCYTRQWGNMLTSESFTHPAKFAPGLIQSIYAHGHARGYWKRGDLIGDPFGGIGGGGIWASWARLRWVGVELEPRFVAMAIENFKIHERGWRQMCYEAPKIVEGDSRQFAERVGGLIAGAVTSPPYAETLSHGGGPDTKQDLLQGGKSLQAIKTGYGDSYGNIGNLKEGKLSVVVTSPPFVDMTSGHDAEFDKKRSGGPVAKEYGDAPGQIGTLPAGKLAGVVTSSPYGGNRSLEKNSGSIDFAANYETYRKNGGGSTFESYCKTQERHSGNYGETEGQIGETTTETYWSAMAQVYASVYQSLKPGGVMACVVKDYVKNKARVPLCDTTLELLIATGFQPVERCRAWLTKETREAGLHEEIVTTKSRKSFFRRLAEKKGSPAIDWEEVLWIRKP